MSKRMKYKNNYKHSLSKKKILDGIDLTNNNTKDDKINSKNASNNNLIEIKKTQNINNKTKLKNISSHDKNSFINKKDNDFKTENIKVNKKNKNDFLNPEKSNINEKIQSFISILFTIIIFIALILIIIVLYNNYFKNNNKSLKIDKEKICKEYIKKDYDIKNDDVLTFIKLNRGIFYNIDTFSNTNTNSKDIINFIIYYIWSSDLPYKICEENEGNCLVSKKEIPLTTLQEALKIYLNYEKDIPFNNAVTEEDDVRIYLEDDKVILTFSEFVFKTHKHDFIETIIEEDNIKVIMALSKQIDENYYSYIGHKIINLKYLDNHFIINNIETKLLKYDN